MRFSTITALCAAPLALAGTLQAELAARGAVGPELTVRQEGKGSQKASAADDNNNNNQKGNANANSGNNGGNVIVVQQAPPPQQITEVIVIWVNNGGNSATKSINSQSAAAAGNAPAAGTAAAAAAATHSVTVGGSAGLVYTPDTIEANVGDMVVFTFMSANHTATQSAFTTPCEALAGGMDSGFMPNPNNSVVPAPQMAMQVTVATPIWFYCRQTGHCGKGMTFSINPQNGTDGNKTQDAFKALAIQQNGTALATAPIAGGAAAPASVAPAASTASSASAAGTANTGSMVNGAGTSASGDACTCSCLCGVAAFPNAAVQGIGGFGGLSGAMPMSALEA